MKRFAIIIATTGLAGMALPWTAAAHTPAADPAFSGYSTAGWAAPVKIEIYEPTVPIPATPQAEVELGYTAVETFTGSGHGRASWVWPGDSAGEGFKTIAEALGLPSEVAENGYPVQVNSHSPNGPESQADEPFPGSSMRTSAGAKQTTAQVGFSPDGDVDNTPSDDSSEGPENPLTEVGEAITGGGTPSLPGAGGADGSGDRAAEPAVPPELAALVDVSSFASVTTSTAAPDLVRTTAAARLGEVALLGGIITVDGVTARSDTTSNGAQGTARGRSTVGAMAVGGQRFSIGSDGVIVGGEPAPIPGLPDDPAEALAALGVHLTLPQQQRQIEGAAADGQVEALRVEIDMRVLRRQLDALPIDDLVGAVPDELGDLKKVIGAAAQLAPRYVITLGNATTGTETVQGIDVPEVPVDTPDDPVDEPETDDDTNSDTGTDAGATTPTGTDPGGTTPTADDSTSDGDLNATPMGAGLPPLTTIPGALTFGGIILAGLAGMWLRKIGGFVLGVAGLCTHGLETGIPDLRRVDQ